MMSAEIVELKEAEIVRLKAENYDLQRRLKKLAWQKVVMLEALEAANKFISIGIEHEYIHIDELPEEGNPSLETLKLIDAAIRKARGEG